MSNDDSCRDRAKSLAKVMCALSLVLTACGGGSDDVNCGDRVCDPSETASSCAEDCGCGNGIANPGEECDLADLGGGTCMDAVNRGGTLRCNADCTFDVSACTLASCGNGVVEEGESCDGGDLGSGTCSSIGYAGGDIACSADCVYEVSACCSDNCPTAGLSECVDNTLRECSMSASGCLAWQLTDCAAGNDICETVGDTATCSCVDRCDTIGETQCEGASIVTCEDVGGCLDWTPSTNCATGGEICAMAPSGPLCVADAAGEDCSEPYPLSPGENVVAWTADTADYMTMEPSCDTYALAGPDLVLSYTAPENGYISIAMTKPSSARQVFVVSSAACGTVEPELACVIDYSPTSIGTELGVEMGVTYYVYVRDTTSGTAVLDNPLFVTVDQTLCSAIDNTPVTLSPANGVSETDVSPIFTADLPYAIDPSHGVITVTGDQGTNLTYDLAMAPSEIAIINGKTLVIDPGMLFPVGETVTISWSGITDTTCAVAVPSPTWTFQVTGPPCAPGMNGMVGDSITRVPTGLSSFTEYFVAADSNANGYVYVGGTANLYRMPKTGGTTQDVESVASLTSSQLGYEMLVDGDQIFTLEATTSSTVTSNLLWRLSSDGGTTWPKENYMQLPVAANDELKAIASYNGRYYMTTDDSSLGVQIWSVAAGATALPENAILEATIADEGYCNGIALDDDYYYLSCYTDDRIIRVNRVTLAKELITDAYYVNITKNALHADDFDGDGHADALYFSSYYEEVDYICKPGGTGPFYSGILASFGSGSSNYGLGLDAVNNVLWMFDDDTQEFIKIE